MATKESSEYVKQLQVVVSKESPKLLVGCLSGSEVLPPGDSEQKRPVVYQDPFRMSVLDFQHRAMERLAEILKSFLLVYIKDMKAKKLTVKDLSREDQEDMQALLKYIEGKAKDLVEVEGFSSAEKERLSKEMSDICKDLLRSRNTFAHQKYVKGGFTPKDADLDALEKSKKKKPEYESVYKSTRTFQNTKAVIEKCIQLSRKVKECMSKSPINEATREVTYRCGDLESLASVFEEFTEYRDLERYNLEVFHRSYVERNTEVKKKVAIQVLEKLQSRIEKGDEDLCALLACVVAPRACLQIDVPKPTKK